MPQKVSEWIERCERVNRAKCNYTLWDNPVEIKSFVKENYPQYATIYDALPYDVQRFDLLRLMILHRFGGIYIDTDVECFRPVTDLLNDDDTCVFALEPQQHAFDYERMPYIVGSYFIAAEAENPFILKLIERIADTVFIKRSVHVPTQIMKSTGPARITEIYGEEKRNYKIRLLPSEFLSPLTAKEVKKYLLGKYYPQLNNAHGQHLYAGSWVDETENRLELELLNFLKDKR